MMQPNPFGLMLDINCFNLARSCALLILVETEILSQKGIKTIKRPAKEISQVRRGPFVEIGSFAICTRTS